MKREFLKNLELEDGVIDAIMAEYGKSHQGFATANAQREALQAELAQTRAALEQAQQQVQQNQTLQDRCTQLERQLADANYGFCVRRAADNLPFSSKSARQAFVTALTAKALPMEGENLAGFDEFLEEYRQNDPDAFAREKEPMPMFVRGGSGKPNDMESGLRAAFGL